MKVLWIAPFLPYDKVDHAGGKVLNYYINSLSDRDAFDVRFIGFSKPSEYKNYTLDKKLTSYISFYHDHGIKKIARNIYDLYSLKCPLDKNGNTTTSYIKLCILRQLRTLKKSGYVPDVIILHWTQTIVFVKEVKKIYDSAKIVGIEEDVSSQACLRKYQNAKGKISRAITKMRYDNITKSERVALNACDLVILNNEKDKMLLKEFNVITTTKVWSVYYDKINVNRNGIPPKHVLFFGDMSRPENIGPSLWLIDKVFPLIKELNLNLVILGGNPPEELRLKATDRIKVTGFVDDIEPYLSSSLCLASPLILGAGIKVKVLTCMAAGIPVCTNDVGIEGIPAKDGKEFLYCKTPEEYASAIRKLYDDRLLADTIATNAQQLIAEKFDFHKNSEDFARWLQEIDKYDELNFTQYDSPEVSIVIPVYNQFDYTYNCLKAIYENSGDVTYEIIIADDCSTDATEHIGGIVSGIKIVRNEENLRFLLNCNNAAKHARGNYILFLNNDTQVCENWLKPLVELMNDKSIGMTGSKLVYSDGRLQEAGGILWKDGKATNFGNKRNPKDPEYNYVKEVDYISGAAIMIRKSLWEEIGGFDERFIPAYYEDTDLAFEVRKHGYRVVYQPLSVVVHFEGISNGTDITSGQKSYQIANGKKFLEKWKDVLEKEHFAPLENIFMAKDRSRFKKHILVIVPNLICDGNNTMYTYVCDFISMGLQVTLIADDFQKYEPYTTNLNQLGVEVLYGSYYKSNWKKFLKENLKHFDYVFLQGSNIESKYMNIIKKYSNAKILGQPGDISNLI